MKKYIINVNGTSYEVEVEEVGGSQPSTPSVSTPAAKPQPVKKAQPAPAPKAAPAPKSVPSGASTIDAPMPGTIMDIKVNEGDSVKAGQVLLILEAMKMENEIVAPQDGTVSAINTSKGASVSAGDPLVSFK